jgi:predicted lipoprotein with Yx(FWY)xxD motif
MNTKRSLLALVVTVLVLVGGAAFVRSVPAAPSTPVAKASLAVGKSDFGSILFDGRGYALYAFTRDLAKRSTCYGACAKAWPPYIVTSRPAAGGGTRTSLIGTTRRKDGTLQATYASRPLYYYVGDNAPGVVRCQNVLEFNGYWLVVRGSGKLVR